MKILIVSLRVIFMLSTIVYATDCCSSRILLVKEETLKLLRQKQVTLTASVNSSSSPSSTSTSSSVTSSQLQHANVMANMAREYSKRFFQGFRAGQHNNTTTTTTTTTTTEEEEEDDPDCNKRSVVTKTSDREKLFRKTSLIVNTETDSSVISIFNRTKDHGKDESTSIAADANTFIIDPAVREKYAGNPKYHVIDLYYTIMRDVLSYECLGHFLTDFCLNGGRCFRYPIANHSFYSCECADGYIGERCESKSMVNELYIPSSSVVLAKNVTPRRPKILMARFVFTFPALIVLTTIYILIAVVLFIRRPKNRAARRYGAAPLDCL